MVRTGRPRAENPKSNRFSIRLDDETQEKLDNYCREHQISKGEAIRRGIHLLLKKQK
jgi:predicted transcriptional regulator